MYTVFSITTGFKCRVTNITKVVWLSGLRRSPASQKPNCSAGSNPGWDFYDFWLYFENIQIFKAL